MVEGYHKVLVARLKYDTPQYVHVIDTGKVRITRESHSSFRVSIIVPKQDTMQLYSVWYGVITMVCACQNVTLTGTSAHHYNAAAALGEVGLYQSKGKVYSRSCCEVLQPDCTPRQEVC